MNLGKRKRAVLAAAALGAVVVAVSTAILIADLAAARRRAPADEALVAELEERVRTDASAAAELAAERERQTERSLAREARGQSLGWVLLASSAVFLASAKWLAARRGPPVPPPERLVHITPADAERYRHYRPPGQQPRSPDRRSADHRDAEEPEVDLALVDDLVARHGRAREAAIPVLQAIQEHYRYLPDDALRRLCELTEITPEQITGSASFYARFRSSPVGEHVVRICHGTACHVAGVEHVTEELRRQLDIPRGGDTDPWRRFTLDPVACLGCCSLAPVMMIGEETAGHLTPASAWEALRRRVAS